MKNFLINISTAVFVCLIWEAISKSEVVDSTLLPPASVVLAELFRELSDPEFFLHLWATVRLMLGGFLLAVVVGTPLGMFMGLSRTLDSILLFYVDFLRSLPAAALIPMFLVLFQGQTARVLVIGTACGVIMAIGGRTGVLNLNKTREEVTTLLGWNSYELFTKFLFWETISEVLLSARIALSTSLILATVIEMLLGSRYGLGDMLINSMPTDKPRMYVAILILGILGYSLNLAFKGMERWMRRIGIYGNEKL